MKLSPHYDGPVVLSIDGQPDDQEVVVSRQRRRLESMLATLDDDQWRAPSRCEGWTVQDVVAHLVGVNGFWEASVTAGLAGRPTRVLAAFDPAAHPPKMVEPMRVLTPRDVLDQFAASNDGFLGALAPLDDRGWSAVAESPVGHVSVRLLAQHALWDAWVHERDIAVPLGLAPALEDDELASCLCYSAAVGPAITRGRDDAFSGDLGAIATGPDIRFTLSVGESVSVRRNEAAPDVPCLHGNAVDLIEALSLRAPLPPDAPSEWRRLVRGLATMFDTEAQAGD